MRIWHSTYGRRNLPWLGYANMAFDLRPTEDVLPWLGYANMAFDLQPTEDVLPWLGYANMAFDLRLTEDVLMWLGYANMAFRPVDDTCEVASCEGPTGDWSMLEAPSAPYI
ncbi:hypothetical protein Tco_0417678 [Tanacetum coccineum]